MRLNLTKIRNSIYLKRFVEGYVKKGNIILIDCWLGYSFLYQGNSGYQHFSFNHGHDLLGEGINTTSHIESFWAFLKNKIKQIYHYIPSRNLIYFIKEAELKYLLREKNNIEILSYLENIFKYCYNSLSFNFCSEDDLLYSIIINYYI